MTGYVSLPKAIFICIIALIATWTVLLLPEMIMAFFVMILLAAPVFYVVFIIWIAVEGFK